MLRAKPARSRETPDATDPQAVASRNDADTLVATIKFYKTTGTVVAQGSPPGVLCFTVVRPQLHLRAMDGLFRLTG